VLNRIDLRARPSADARIQAQQENVALRDSSRNTGAAGAYAVVYVFNAGRAREASAVKCNTRRTGPAAH
jgi:hypothetical protein